eukprot:TRINITY_DN75547_c0_g1_i1.p1 TRINITY_DN75547_c0_g1~~TRINITY_DN75547_c0_g1_i1.p1  ORF type:complete len:514 (-),score=77.21 TRINITY_DN75547_c0_g1_i1:84-1625(-)
MVPNYELVKHIGRGRFGSSMLVRCDGKRQYVFRVIELDQFEGKRNQMLTEMSEVAKLKHAYLINIKECFVNDGCLCIIQDFAGGGHAWQRIDRARSCEPAQDIPEGTYLKWFVQAASALGHMHACNSVHGDLRTRRLMLTANDDVLLSGTELAPLYAYVVKAVVPELEAIRYSSPEMVLGLSGRSVAADLWALGLILFELASLQPAFDHVHPRGLSDQILNTEKVALPCKCSPEVVHLCGVLLRREPEGRTPAASALRSPVIQSRIRALSGTVGEKKGLHAVLEVFNKSERKLQSPVAWSAPATAEKLAGTPTTPYSGGPVKPPQSLRPVGRHSKVLPTPRAAMLRRRMHFGESCETANASAPRRQTPQSEGAMSQRSQETAGFAEDAEAEAPALPRMKSEDAKDSPAEETVRDLERFLKEVEEEEAPFCFDFLQEPLSLRMSTIEQLERMGHKRRITGGGGRHRSALAIAGDIGGCSSPEFLDPDAPGVARKYMPPVHLREFVILDADNSHL